MRTALPLFLLVACNTPGTFGSAIFQSADDGSPSEAEMISQLEAEPVVTPTPERVLAEVPALPTNTWIQVFDRTARITHRILDDGRYTVQVGAGTAQEMPVISQAQPETKALTADARSRIESALHTVRFHAVAPHVPEVELDPSQAVALVQLRPLAITVRDTGSGRVHTVHLQADARVPATFGPVEPLWRTLDAEVFGRWLESAVATSGPAPVE